ncbi:hypothetical protein E3N88_39329 [Mikania micrantha]|uniref:Reverse transcriptase Ty1/copia-type domain-containing protein n=1 Tax=Mikania micrantha TaxID=192012 RepID=A0A5N6LZ26_9ASTR|nr:hypothetical protein E3N88_39329 [Mikania micrantha]
MFDLNILQHEFPVEPNVEAHEVLTADPPKASTETTHGSPDDEDESTHLFRFSDNLPLSAKSDAPPAPVTPPTTNADEILVSSTSFEILAELFPGSSSTSAAAEPPANTCTDLIPYQELKDLPLSQILGDISAGVSTRSQLSNFCLYALFVSQQEPKNYHTALKDNGWVEAMQLELLQFKKQQVWELVPLPQGKCAIGTKWVFRNKTDENGQIIKNKARLVVQGFSQEEGIDYDETFAPVARLEAIRLLLAYAALHKLKVFQMDVKSAFLYGKIKEEVYVCQPPGFEDNKHPDWVYKLDKALYGLKQAPRAWYDTLSTFLLKNNFTRGSIDKTLFIKNVGQHKLLVQIYVDDIIFASSDLKLCDAFTELMTKNFEMSAMGELQFFLGLQIKQKPDGIFIHQSKYTKELLKKFDLQNCKPCSNPMSSTTQLDADLKGTSVDETLYRCMIGSLMYLTASRPDIMFATCVCARFQAAPKESHLIAVKRIFRYLQGTQSLGIWYSTGHSCKLVAFSDSDYAGCKLSRKSTSGGCQFLGNCLVSWQSKKQTSVATSTVEAEYIAAASCTSQILWLQSQLLDYGIKELKTPLLMDSASALCIVKNPDEAIDKSVLYNTEVENQLNKKIKVLRSYRGGEYVSSFANICARNGIIHKCTAPCSSQQNAKMVVPPPKVQRLGPKTLDCVFIGYAHHSSAYRFLIHDSKNLEIHKNTIMESRNASFFEKIFPCLKKKLPSSLTTANEIVHNEDQEQLEAEEVDPRQSKRQRIEKSFGPDFLTYMVEGEPQTYREVVTSLERPQWKEAIKNEIDSILQNHTWELVDLTPRCKPLGYRRIFKRKMKADGSIDKYKTTLAIKGFRQKEGVDYFDTYAHVTRITSIRLVLAIAALRNLEVHQMDFKTVFLNGDLEEKIYMEQPEGFSAPSQEGKVYDMFIVGSDDKMIKSTKDMLKARFNMKYMGLADVILGIKINRTQNGLVLIQSHYEDKILEKFNTGDTSVAHTSIKLEKKQNDYINLWKTFQDGQSLCQLFAYIVIANLTISRAQSAMYNGKSRHIQRRHNTIRQLLSMGVISIDYVRLKDNIMDSFTKGLSKELVYNSSRGMGLKPFKKVCTKENLS